MKGKIPLFLRLTLMALLALPLLFLPITASAMPAAVPVLDEGVIVSVPSTDYGAANSFVATAPSLELMPSATVDEGIAITAVEQGTTTYSNAVVPANIKTEQPGAIGTIFWAAVAFIVAFAATTTVLKRRRSYYTPGSGISGTQLGSDIAAQRGAGRLHLFTLVRLPRRHGPPPTDKKPQT